MINFRLYPAHPSIATVARHYLMVDGTLPPGMRWQHMVIPTMSEWIFFNPGQTPQDFYVQGEKVVLHDCLITSQYPESFYADFAGEVKLFGIHLNQTYTWRLFNVPLNKFYLHSILLTDLMGSNGVDIISGMKSAETAQAIVEIADKFIYDRMQKLLAPNNNLLNALSTISTSNGKILVRDLSLSTKVSERGLQKLFLKDIGVTPKEYIRVERFNRAVKMLLTSKTYSWKVIVEELGYYDQAHFINDFQAISGMLPSQYFVNHSEVHQFFSKLQ